MDEAIRIYPSRQLNALYGSRETFKPAPDPEPAKPIDLNRKQKWYETLKEVFDEAEEKTQELAEKYTLHVIIYRWIVAMAVVALFISFIIWGVNIHTDNIAQERTNAALADYQAGIQAEQQAQAEAEEAARQTEAYIVDQMATALSRVFAGISRFEDKYSYGENDFMTLAWCVFNRVDSDLYPDNIYDVINQPSQWVGYDENSQPIAKYKDLATKAILEWRNSDTRPITNDYLWAEQTPNGVYLKNDYNADGYARRWQYR